MQQMNDPNGKDTNRENDDGSPTDVKPEPVKQKHVGDETPNPLPDDDYSSKQPSGDTAEGSPQGDSSVD